MYKMEDLSFHPYEIPLTTGKIRTGCLIHITDRLGNCSISDVAPLPQFSLESLTEAIQQFKKKKEEILHTHWGSDFLEKIDSWNLFPSVQFALESALLSIFSPRIELTIPTSALLMGSFQEILHLARLRQQEGFTSAKLKVNNLSFKEAFQIIHTLKDTFQLRIDVNRAWNTTDSLEFFSKFPENTFDYVEEPFQNPHDLDQFTLHPLAVDESFPSDLSLKELESLPNLRALIYKPTIQGGIFKSLHLHEWTQKRKIQFILSSSFESDVGLMNIVSLANLLSLKDPIGIGTYHYLSQYLGDPLFFTHSHVTISSKPWKTILNKSNFQTF